MLNFLGFLKFINREYITTFFNNQTAKEFLCETWRNGKTDKERVYIFSKHRSYYKSINKELKVWIGENWDNWEEGREEWFNAKMISRIPSDMLPDQVLESMGGKQGRKASIEVMKEEEKEKKRVRRGSDLKIIPDG